MIGFFDVTLSQRACRRFSAKPVADEAVELCLLAATHAPSAENSQPWEFIVVRDPGLRGQIGALTQSTWRHGGRQWSRERLSPGLLADVDSGAEGGIAAAPVLIVVCGNSERALEGTLGPSVYPATQNLLLAAAAQGLGSAMTTLVLQRSAHLTALLGLPDHVRPMAVVPLGHPERPLGPPRRLPVAERAHRDRWGGAW